MNKANIRKEKSTANGVAYFGVAIAVSDDYGHHIVIYQTERQLKERFPYADSSKFYKVALFKSDDVEVQNE